MISGVRPHCSCGNVQDACLQDTSAISRTVEDFNRGLRRRTVSAGPKRLRAYERRKLRKVLLGPMRQAALVESDRQVCSKCGAVYSR